MIKNKLEVYLLIFKLFKKKGNNIIQINKNRNNLKIKIILSSKIDI